MVFLVPLPCKHPLHTPNTKVHQQGCTFVFGVVPSPYSTRRTRKDTNEGVFSCSALFFRPTPHAECEKTPTRVSFRVRHCSFALHHMLNARRHQRGCLFVFGIFAPSYHTRRARQYTLVGVISCPDPFLPPQGRLLIILVLLNTYYIYIKSIYLSINRVPREFGGKPAPVVAGRESCGYGCVPGTGFPAQCPLAYSPNHRNVTCHCDPKKPKQTCCADCKAKYSYFS
jgi:hypothetical protein